MRNDPPGYPPSLEERGLSSIQGKAKLGEMDAASQEALRQEAEHRVRQELRGWIAENDRRVDAETARIARSARRMIVFGFLGAAVVAVVMSLALTKYLTRELRDQALAERAQASDEMELLRGIRNDSKVQNDRVKELGAELGGIDRRLGVLAASNENPRGIAAAQAMQIARIEGLVQGTLRETKLKLEQAAIDEKEFNKRMDSFEDSIRVDIQAIRARLDLMSAEASAK